jgi:hypothetical protein
MEGSGSIKIITDPEPGGPKTYGLWIRKIAVSHVPVGGEWKRKKLTCHSSGMCRWKNSKTVSGPKEDIGARGGGGGDEEGQK